MSKIEVSTWYCSAKNRSEGPEVGSPYRVSCWLFLNLKVQIHDLNSITNRFCDRRDSGAFLAGSWGFALFGRAISGAGLVSSESSFSECSAGSVSSIEPGRSDSDIISIPVPLPIMVDYWLFAVDC